MAAGGIPGGGGGVRGLLNGLAAPASGLRAQKARIDTIAHNLANAGTSAPAGTDPYRRRIVELDAVAPGSGRADGAASPAPLAPPAPPPFPPIGGDLPLPGARDGDDGVRITGVAEDSTEGPMIYDPGHPDADAQGYVRYSNVDTTREIVDLLEARRLFEANVTVFEAMKSVLRRSIDI